MAEVGLLPFARIALQSPGRCSRAIEAVSATRHNHKSECLCRTGVRTDDHRVMST